MPRKKETIEMQSPDGTKEPIREIETGPDALTPEADFEKAEPLTWADGDEGLIDRANDRLNPFNTLTKPEKDRLRLSRILRARQKVRCYITRKIDDRLYLVGVKRPRANQQTFFGFNFTYQIDLERVVIMASEPILIYEENIAEPLKFSAGKITGSQSIQLDMLKRSEIVKQVFRGLAGGGNKADMMIYVMMGVVAIATFVMGYAIGSGGFFHAAAPATTSTAPPVVKG